MPPKKRLKSLGGESMSKFLKKDETNETEAHLWQIREVLLNIRTFA